MSKCPYDGFTVYPIGKDMYKCMYCNQYFKEKNGELVLYSLRAVPYGDMVQESLEITGLGKPKTRQPQRQQQRQREEQPVERLKTSDEEIFASRVAKALTPIKGKDMNRKERGRALGVRRKYERQLMEVLEGERDFDEWFDETKSWHGLRSKELAEILYNALEGLTSEEAQAMRQAYEQVLKQGPV